MKELTPHFANYYMDIAERTAAMSYATRLKVGSVIVVDNGIVSTGYNGQPKGHSNECERYDLHLERLVTLDSVIHAEDNAIQRIYERNIRAVGGSIFITHSPCIKCAKKILKEGITNVIFKHYYKNDLGIDYLSDNHVNVFKL